MWRKKQKSTRRYFTVGEIALWGGSVLLIMISFLLFDGGKYFTLVTSLIGATALIFNAKGNPFGQILMILFSLLYGVISFSFAYYGEMITYLGMTAPMALIALISWLKNPYNGNRSEVKIHHLTPRELLWMTMLTCMVTVLFYFILAALHTAHLLLSTISVATSFVAAYLTFRRSELYAIAYAANDVTLIVLWILATISEQSYRSVAICFAVFFVNDIYGFIHWRHMKKRQKSGNHADESEREAN